MNVSVMFLLVFKIIKFIYIYKSNTINLFKSRCHILYM